MITGKPKSKSLVAKRKIWSNRRKLPETKQTENAYEPAEKESAQINSKLKSKRFGGKNQELENLIPKTGEKAPSCWYPVLMIIMCVKLILQASLSFRAVPKAVHIAFSQFAAVKNQQIPSHKTVGRWLTQIGLYKLNRPKEKADDWALIIDNSVQIGTQKCLVVLGIKLSEFQGKALCFEDMEMLVMELHNQSDAKTVCKALEKAQDKVGKVVTACADDGPDLRKGIAIFCKKHQAGRVFDVVHKIGTFLKKLLENDPEWQAFASAAAEAKKKMQQTQAAHLAPPNQRTKSRFLNIEILVHWGIDVSIALRNPKHPDKQLLEQYCGWIRQHAGVIERLKQLDLISQKVRHHIREGISNTTGDEVEVMLESLDLGVHACQYAGMLIDFLQEQSKVVPAGQVWIGSSEIIESLFGKLKCLENDQSKGGFTSLVLGAAACVGKIDVDVVKAAMKQVKTSDVEAWTRDQMGTTLLSKRRQALGSWRRKKKKKERLKQKKLSKNMEHKSTGKQWRKVMGF